MRAMGSTAGQTSRISAKKLALLKKLRKREGEELSPSSSPLAITRRKDTSSYPLSFAQQRLWFLDQVEAGAPVYNLTVAWQLNGYLDVPALERSLREIVQRHEVLRSSFSEVEGFPLQRISAQIPNLLRRIDLQSLESPRKEREAMRLGAREHEQPFDLSQGPLLRAVLLRLHERTHILVVCQHHIVSDAWSIDVLRHELVTLYNAFAQGRPSPLPALPVQYADFAHWQRAWLQGEVLEQQLAYWKQQLAGAATALELPTDWPRPAIQTFGGAVHSFFLPTILREALQTLCYRENVTLFMVLLAAFQVLLGRYSGQEDILVGTPISQRTRTELEGLVGFFVNTLVLRTDLSGNPTFLELLARVREVALGAYSHQDIPFERIVDAVQVERSLSRSPLFQVMCSWRNAGGPAEEFIGLTSCAPGIDDHVAKFDLSLDFQETDNGIEGQIEYNTDLFSAATIERFVSHYQQLLSGIVADPGQRIYTLPLLSASERARVLRLGQAPRHSDLLPCCLHQLFEAQVQRTPEQIALVMDDAHLTYQQLNQRANQLAHWLQARQVGPGTIVALCLERCPEQLIGLLGILKAGGAYLPVDPTYPPQRLAFLLTDAHAAIVLTQSHLLARLPITAEHVLCLHADGGALSASSQQNPRSAVQPGDLACLIYTSGSTGTPKGVLVPHRALVNHAGAIAGHYHLTSADRVLQFASLSFDAAAEELFPPWSVGATVVLRAADLPATFAAFVQTVERQALTVLDLPTAYWHSWVEEMQSGSQVARALPASLRLVIVGGEQASAMHLSAWRQQVGERVWWSNTYGPTEATVTTTIYDPEPGRVDRGRVPIGRPIPNAWVNVLDRGGQPVPLGVRGEICIGGAGVAQGYLHRQELTGERFVPDAFGREAGGRLYRTGDLGRYRADGRLEYLGRLDQQVKLRGFRIEPGEIEAVLSRHAAVRQAVVLVRQQEQGMPWLVAYLLVEPGQEPGMVVEQVSAYLRQQVPAYLLPGRLVVLDAFPLTPNGKVDKRALELIEVNDVRTREDYLAPRDAIELQLIRIWEELLHISPLGITDNFFELGGHSLLAVRLMARIQSVFGQDLPLATLFQGATVEHLALLLRQQKTCYSQSPLIPIQTQGSMLPLFLVHPIGGTVLCYRQLSQHLGREQPVYGLQAPGLNGEQAPFTDLRAMAAHYIAAIKEIQPRGPYKLGGWSMGGIVAFEMAQQLLQQDEQVAMLTLFDSYIPLDIPVTEDAATVTLQFAQDLGLLSGQELPVTYETLQMLEPEKHPTYMLELLQQANVIPADIGEQQLQHLLHVFKANLYAVQHYQLQPYPGSLILFRARDELVEDQADSPGWERYVTQGISTYTVPGNHYTMLQETGTTEIAEIFATLRSQ